MPVPTDSPRFGQQSAGNWEAALLEIEHQAQHWDTLDHGETGHFIAQTLRAAARLAVGEDPAVIAAQIDHLGGDRRQRLLGAADALLRALEDAYHSRDLRYTRGDLARLRDDVSRMRRTVERRAGVCEFWS
jgi:hypothetical protein